MRYQPTIDLRPVMRAAGPYEPTVWPKMQPGQWVTVGDGVRGQFRSVSKANIINIKWRG